MRSSTKKEDDGNLYNTEIYFTAGWTEEISIHVHVKTGTYYFQVVNGAGVVSTPVTEIKISNIKSDTPLIVFRTDNGYDPATWSGKPVTREVNKYECEAELSQER